jgi:hypothetical protein
MSMGPAKKLTTYAAALAIAFAAAWSLGSALAGTSTDNQAVAAGGPSTAPLLVPGPDASSALSSQPPPAETTTVPAATTAQRTVGSPGNGRLATAAGAPEVAATPADQEPSTPSEPGPTTAPPEPSSPPETSPDNPTPSPSEPSPGCEPGGFLGPVICAVLSLLG